MAHERPFSGLDLGVHVSVGHFCCYSGHIFNLEKKTRRKKKNNLGAIGRSDPVRKMAFGVVYIYERFCYSWYVRHQRPFSGLDLGFNCPKVIFLVVVVISEI